MLKKLLSIILLVLTIGMVMLIAGHFGDCVGSACANDPDEAEVMRAVQVLQPAHSPALAASWGGVIYEAGAEAGIDPLLITALAFRESSIRNDVVGTRGEVGAMQLHGAALSFRPRRCDPTTMACSIRGGAAVLSYWRAECQVSSWNIWVGAYGLGRCPDEDEAAGLRSVRRARTLYERVGGTRWE